MKEAKQHLYIKRVKVKSKTRFIIFMTAISMVLLTTVLSSLFPPIKAQGIELEQSAVCEQVEPGDTLWALAKKHTPERMDIRKYIEIVKKYNDIPSADIKIGQVIEFPKK